MKTSGVTAYNPFVMTEWVPRKDRVELSLIFMVVASVGQVVLVSRGFPLTGEFLSSMAGGFAFGMFWVIPKLTRCNVARTLILGFIWSALSIAIDRQVEAVMAPPVSHQEVYSQ